mmetsp:Transcript_48394/g.98817  ORF Transcript_48394/g.98817 Transcript_48394/m.98817 type:complete len:367 (+) Transcript_48394:270-1370(+)
MDRLQTRQRLVAGGKGRQVKFHVRLIIEAHSNGHRDGCGAEGEEVTEATLGARHVALVNGSDTEKLDGGSGADRWMHHGALQVLEKLLNEGILVHTGLSLSETNHSFERGIFLDAVTHRLKKDLLRIGGHLHDHGIAGSGFLAHRILGHVSLEEGAPACGAQRSRRGDIDSVGAGVDGGGADGSVTGVLIEDNQRVHHDTLGEGEEGLATSLRGGPLIRGVDPVGALVPISATSREVLDMDDIRKSNAKIHREVAVAKNGSHERLLIFVMVTSGCPCIVTSDRDLDSGRRATDAIREAPEADVPAGDARVGGGPNRIEGAQPRKRRRGLEVSAIGGAVHPEPERVVQSVAIGVEISIGISIVVKDP